MSPRAATKVILPLLPLLSSALPTLSNRSNSTTPIPSYALTFAPHLYLYSGESWYPSDIATHTSHVSVEYNYANVSSSATLQTLPGFNSSCYLTSYEDVETNPSWLTSGYGKPGVGGYSAAPGTIVAVEKDGGSVVDVFYFLFYSYNHGDTVLNTRVDNHIGDWEHVMIRFQNSTPSAIYLSAHTSGGAYEWSAMDFEGERPVVYIASGSHANYATAGKHDIYAIIGNLVTDVTDAGTYWDVTQNYRGFWLDNSTQTFSSAGGASIGGTKQESEGVDWLYWLGKWGDEEYPTSDPRQDCILGIDDLCHYESGPTGPFDKNLGRTTICEHESNCDVANSI